MVNEPFDIVTQTSVMASRREWANVAIGFAFGAVLALVGVLSPTLCQWVWRVLMGDEP